MAIDAPDNDIRGIGMTSARTRERLVARLREKGIEDPRVLEVIRNTPRHLFIEEALAHQAYDDNALPIGYGQTISQPWVVARMTELLIQPGRPGKVLEIGTGSGYQTAVLAPLCDQVFSVERVQPLLERAREKFLALEMRNVQVKHADGGLGWFAEAPFDRILAAAVRAEVPQDLLKQLAEGGRLVMPVGDDRQQYLTVVDRVGDEYITQRLDPVRFVRFERGVVRG